MGQTIILLNLQREKEQGQMIPSPFSAYQVCCCYSESHRLVQEKIPSDFSIQPCLGDKIGISRS